MNTACLCLNARHLHAGCLVQKLMNAGKKKSITLVITSTGEVCRDRFMDYATLQQKIMIYVLIIQGWAVCLNDLYKTKPFICDWWLTCRRATPFKWPKLWTRYLESQATSCDGSSVCAVAALWGISCRTSAQPTEWMLIIHRKLANSPCCRNITARNYGTNHMLY